MVSFTSSIGTAIYQVLFVFYSYLNDDTETATFDHTLLALLAMLNDSSPRLSCDGKILVIVHDWLKCGFGSTRK